MWSIAHLLLPTTIFVGQLAVGLDTPTAIRTDSYGNQIEIDLEPFQSFDPFPGQIASPARHDGSDDGWDGPEYSLNWCGAKANISVANPIVWVQAQIIVPNLKVHILEPLPQMVEAWVGIGGDTCRTGLLQVGVHAVINTVGGVTSQNTTMFVRLWPGFNYEVDEQIKPDDVFNVTIDLNNSTRVFITTNNASKNTTDTFQTRYDVAIPMPPEGICPGDVEWIVSTGSEGKAFADFDLIKFSNSTARQKDTSQIFVHDAEMVWVQDGQGNITCASEKTDNSREINMARRN